MSTPTPDTPIGQLSLLQHAAVLARFIDSLAGDFPLLSALPKDVGQGILCQYTCHDFIFYVSSERKFPSMDALAEGSPTSVSVLSLDESFNLVEEIERLRQNTCYPRIALGRMPGTTFTGIPLETPSASH